MTRKKMEKIDIVILDLETEVVTFVKEDPQLIAEKFDNDVERYIEESLEFKLSQVSWMCGAGIRVEMFGGVPNGGLQVTNEDYSDAQE